MKMLAVFLVAFVLGMSADMLINNNSVNIAMSQSTSPDTDTICAKEAGIEQPVAGLQQNTPNPIASNNLAATKPMELNQLLELAIEHESVADPYSQLVDRLLTNPEERQRVLDRLNQETDPEKREKLISLFYFVDAPEVVDAAVDMTRESNSETRKDGYRLIQNAQLNSPVARGLLLDSFSREEDPDALAVAVSSLQPGATFDHQDKSRVIAELDKLTQHQSPEVRGEVVLAMSRWDKSPRVETLVQNALMSSEGQEVKSALTALAENPVRSDKMKSSLFTVAANGSLDYDSRWRAVDVLSGFDLSSEDLQKINSLRSTLLPLTE
jgi:hypothetical protein